MSLVAKIQRQSMQIILVAAFYREEIVRTP
jgi:hypothetical protein